MLLFLFLVFIVVPVMELFLLIQVGQLIGTWETVTLVLLTGVVGAYAAKTQGRALLHRFQQQLQQGELPTESLSHGLLILIGGILLITPGLITDTVGLAMILPITRALFLKILLGFIQRGLRLGRIHVESHHGDFFSGMEWSNIPPQGTSTSPPRKKEIHPPPLKEADVINIKSFKQQGNQQPK